MDDLDSLQWHGVWIEDFLRFCAAENLPVDFVFCHPYPTDWALDGQGQSRGRSRSRDSLHADMTWLREAVARSAYPNAEIHLTEWSSSPSPRDCEHDWLPAADYIVKSNLDCAHLADSLSYWVFTDIFEEGGGGPETFHGGFGLMSMHGIRKLPGTPIASCACWAIRWLTGRRKALSPGRRTAQCSCLPGTTPGICGRLRPVRSIPIMTPPGPLGTWASPGRSP